MPTPDLIQAINLPTFGDAPAIPAHIADTWYAMIGRGLPRFANMTALGTAYPSPTAGQAAIVNGVLYLYVDGSWEYVQGSPVASTSDIDSPVAGMTARVGVDEFHYNGTIWVPLNAEITYTPTLTNITVGDGTLVSHYTLLPGGRRMHIDGSIDFTTGGSISGTIGWGIPSGWTLDPDSRFGTIFGRASARAAGATGSNFNKGFAYNNGNTNRVGMLASEGSGSVWNASTPASTIDDNGGFLTIDCTVPVVPA